MEQEFSEKNLKEAASMMSDTKKINEAIEKIKANKKFVSATMDYVNSNQNVKANIEEIKRDMETKGTAIMGQDVSVRVRRKMIKKQKMMMDLAKQPYNGDELDCVCMSQNGKINSMKFNPSEIEADKWVAHPVFIGNIPFIAISNAYIYSGKNTIASLFIEKDTCGPVIFMMLDPNKDLARVDVSVVYFKDLVKRHITVTRS